MNKHLKTLAIEAGFVVTDEFTLDDAKLVKLSELIVDACADRIVSTSDRYRKEYFAQKVRTLFGE